MPVCLHVGRARQVVDEPFNYGYALRRPVAVSNGPGTICTQPNDPIELGIGVRSSDRDRPRKLVFKAVFMFFEYYSHEYA